MPFAVMQRVLEPPTIDQLKAAFRGVPGLVPADAYVLGKDAFGVLVKGFTFERATALKGSLATQGIETDVVDESELPKLPVSRQVRHIELTTDALMIFDPIGKSFPLRWSDIMLIAAGKVAMEEVKQERIVRVVPTPNPWRNKAMPREEVDYETRLEKTDHLLLEIVVRGAVLRYGFIADKTAHILFQCLGDRKTDNVEVNFKLLVQDLTKFAPDVAINQGAYYLRENSDKVFFYPSKNAFYEEMVWLLWKMKRGD